MDFVTFRHKSTGVLANYPEHYATHPVFGYDLERYFPEEEAPVVTKKVTKQSDTENNKDI